MNFDMLPQAVQKFIAETGLEDRIVGVAPISGDYADQEVIDRFLLPSRHNVLLSHYTSWERLEQALIRSSFCMKRVDRSSGDDRSGSSPMANLHSASAMDQDLERQFPTVRDKRASFASSEVIRTRAYEHCWFEGWKECPKMWKDYGWNGAGVCIQTRSFSLFGAANDTSPDFDMLIGGCFYRNDDEPIPAIIGSLPLFCKRRQFEGENEVRLIAAINERRLKRPADDLEWVPLKSMDFIERVVLGPRIPPNEQALVIGKAKQMLSSVTILPSMMAASEIG